MGANEKREAAMYDPHADPEHAGAEAIFQGDESTVEIGGVTMPQSHYEAATSGYRDGTLWTPAVDEARAEVLAELEGLEPVPTQVRRPWRSTARTLFQALVALAVLFPILVENTGLDAEDAPWLAIPLAVAATLTRLMALPQVEDFLARFLPFLAAAPQPPAPPAEEYDDTEEYDDE